MYTPSTFQGYNTYFKQHLQCYTLAFQNSLYKTETLYPLNNISPFPLLPVSANHWSTLCIHEFIFLDSIYKWDYTIFVYIPLILVLICISLMISDAEHLLLYLFFLLLEGIWLLIQSTYLCVCSGFLLLLDSVLVGCMFLGIYSFLSAYEIFWHTGGQNYPYNQFIFKASTVMSHLLILSFHFSQ